MRKSKINISLTCLLIVILLTVGSWTGISIPKVNAITSGDYMYDLVDSKAELTGYLGTDTNVIIPEIIDGYPVTVIRSYTFNIKGLESVIIPDSVISIGNLAFNSNPLTSVVIGNSVTSIGDQAFTHNQLKSVVIPDSVTSIGNSAFYGNQLKSVVIGDSVTSIGNDAFYGNQLESLVIGDSVTSIGGYAFFGNQLESVVIPDSVTSIGGSAFRQNLLKSIVIPNSVTSIGNSAFYGNQLEKISVETDFLTLDTTMFDLSHSPTIIGFNPSTTKTFADSNSLSFVNILINDVTFAPNGEAVGKSSISTEVTVTLPDSVSTADLHYQWTKSETEPDEGDANWTTFNNKDKLTTPVVVGDWYLHIKVDDNTYTPGFTHSKVFKVANSPSYTPQDNHITSTDGHLYLPVGRRGEMSLDEKIKIIFPKNDKTYPIELTITKIEEAEHGLTQRDILLSDAYNVENNLTEALNPSATLIMKFNQATKKPNQTSAIFRYDEATKTWVKVEGGKVEGNQISVPVHTLTKFVVLAVDDEAESSQPLFTDLRDHWANEAILQAIELGIINGYPDGTFKPNLPVTRAEFAVMLMKALHSEAEASELNFTDTEEIGEWAKEAIAQATHVKFVRGYPDSSFKPQKNLNRTEAAIVISNILALREEDDEAVTSFSDDKAIPFWAKSRIAALQSIEILKGREDNKFYPHENVSRAEAVNLIINVINKLKK